jgi:hypothetical protein
MSVARSRFSAWHFVENIGRSPVGNSPLVRSSPRQVLGVRSPGLYFLSYYASFTTILSFIHRHRLKADARLNREGGAQIRPTLEINI